MQKIEYPSVGEVFYCDTLPNGLKLSVIPKPGFARCFAQFATRYGGADRRFRLGGSFIDTPMGVAHFLEHKMFDMPSGDNALAVLAANGAQPNAYTSSGVTAYHFESTSGFDENLRMLLKFVSTPYFTDESVRKEQGIIGQEIRMGEDDPDRVIYDELLRCLYDHHPVRDSVAGTVESIAEITPETLYNCHRIFYNPGNMALAVVGDVDPEAVRAAAVEILPAEAGEVPGRDYGAPEGPLPAKARFTRAMAVSAPQFLIGAKLPAGLLGTELLRQRLLARLALRYLYGQSSPFYLRLYESGLLNPEFFVDTDDEADTMTLVAGGETRAPEEVFSALLDEAGRAAEEGIDHARFVRVTRAGFGGRVRALDSFYGLCAAMTDADFGDYRLLDTFEVCESITEEELRAFIGTWFRRENFAMSVIEPMH